MIGNRHYVEHTMKKNTSTPRKYQVISDRILLKIKRGELVSGDRLPGVRALGEEFGCNYHTVRRAFDELAKQGYLALRPGSGTFITDSADETKKHRVCARKILRTSDQIGILLPLKQWGHYVTSLLNQLHHSAAERGLKLNIRTVTQVDINSVSLVREFMEQGCCSIIIPWLGEDQQPVGLHDFIRASELPVVIANPVHGLEENCYWDSFAETDPRHSDTYLQCAYFHALGFRKIALLGPGSGQSEYFQRKLMQYSRWCDLEDHQNLIAVVDRSRRDYNRVIRQWAPHRGELAVIAYHDEMALEFMDAVAANGLSVPADFALLGHNNNPKGPRSSPSLSSLSLPYAYVAEGMIGHALALSSGDSAQLTGPEPQTFHIRESCGGYARVGKRRVEAILHQLMSEQVTTEIPVKTAMPCL